MSALYEITGELQSILESLEDGELDDDARKRLDNLEQSLQEKAVNVAAYIRNLEVTEAAIKDAEIGMRKRRQSMQKRSSWLRQYLLENMESAGIKKISSPLFQLGVQKNQPSVLVTDQASLPDDVVTLVIEMKRAEYRKVFDSLCRVESLVTEVKINRNALRADLKTGKKIDGAELIQSNRVNIR